MNARLVSAPLAIALATLFALSPPAFAERLIVTSRSTSKPTT